MYRYMYVWMDGWKDGWMDEWMDGYMMYRWMNTFSNRKTFSLYKLVMQSITLKLKPILMW